MVFTLCGKLKNKICNEEKSLFSGARITQDHKVLTIMPKPNTKVRNGKNAKNKENNQNQGDGKS